MRRGLWGLLLGLAATASVGCKDLHYFDVNVLFTGFGAGSAVSTIETCHVYVTGADTADFYVTKNCPPPNSGVTMGVFEYSTNADSGSLTFTMKTYNGIPEDPNCAIGSPGCCRFGEGSVTIPIGATTVNGELMVMPTGGGCD
jgi:hypothetical protein